jgi:acid phosphatase
MMPAVLVLRGLVLLFVAAAAAAAPLPEIPLTPRGAVLRLAVTGDTGKGTEAVARGIARLHAEKPFDGIILAGDTFYPCGVTSENDARWSLVAPLTRIGAPLFPVLGNHDYCGKSEPAAQVRATGVVANWRFPARQYVVRTKFADFAFVDTTPLVRGRRNDVVPAIREAFAKSKAPWRVVVGHHPVISSGYHGYFPREEVRRMRGIIPDLQRAKVKFFIGGHDHHQELIRGKMLHLISGAGSSPVPAIKLRITTVFPSEIRLEPIGFAVVEIDARAIRVRFYDATARPRSEWIPNTR